MAGSTVVLRKCGEHEGCQLESRNDGPWRHTPASRPLVERLTQRPEDQGALRLRLAGEVSAANKLRTLLSEQVEGVTQRLGQLDDVVALLPKVETRHREAAAVGERLAELQRDTEVLAVRLRAALERVDAVETTLQHRISQVERAQEQNTEVIAEGEQRAIGLQERLLRADGFLQRADDLVGKLSRLDEVLAVVRASEDSTRGALGRVNARIDAVAHDIAHERAERLEATEKSVRTDQLLAGRIEEMGHA